MLVVNDVLVELLYVHINVLGGELFPNILLTVVGARSENEIQHVKFFFQFVIFVDFGVFLLLESWYSVDDSVFLGFRVEEILEFIHELDVLVILASYHRVVVLV